MAESIQKDTGLTSVPTALGAPASGPDQPVGWDTHNDWTKWASKHGIISNDETEVAFDWAQESGQSFQETMGGFVFPANTDLNRLHQTLDWAKSFAANVGWKFFPNAKNFWAIYGGGDGVNYQGAANWWFRNMSPDNQKALPWAYYGMDRDSWMKAGANINLGLQTLIGRDSSALSQEVLNTAAVNGWSQGDLSTWLLKHEGQQYGWLRHGKTYTDMQKDLTENKAYYESRFGHEAAKLENWQSVGAKNYVSDLDNPLDKVSGQGAQTSYSGQSQAQLYGQQNALTTYNQGGVR